MGDYWSTEIEHRTYMADRQASGPVAVIVDHGTYVQCLSGSVIDESVPTWPID